MLVQAIAASGTCKIGAENQPACTCIVIQTACIPCKHIAAVCWSGEEHGLVKK